MTHLPLLLFALHAPALAVPPPPPAFVSHPGPPITLAPGLAELGRGLGMTLASPFLVRGLEAGMLGGALIAAVAMQPFDQRLYDYIHAVTHVSSRRPGFFNLSLYLGEGWVDLVAVSLFSLGGPRARRTAVEGMEALAAVAIESTIAKRLFRVPRPNKTRGAKSYFQRFYLIDSKDDAFPSGHTMSAFAAASVIAHEYPDSTPFVYSASTLVGLSVVEKGWHWPSDVIAGAALGFVIGHGAVLANEHLHIGLGPSSEGLGLAANGHF